MHPYSDDWPALKQQVASFLNQFSSGSEELLHYVGLLPNYFVNVHQEARGCLSQQLLIFVLRFWSFNFQ